MNDREVIAKLEEEVRRLREGLALFANKNKVWKHHTIGYYARRLLDGKSIGEIDKELYGEEIR
jgi:hypothetical protein